MPSKSQLEGPVILPPLKDRAELSPIMTDFVPYEFIVCPYYLQIMAKHVQI